jgi:hypothetical protein
MSAAEQLIHSLTQLINSKATNPYYSNQYLYWEDMKRKIEFIKKQEKIKC